MLVSTHFGIGGLLLHCNTPKRVLSAGRPVAPCQVSSLANFCIFFIFLQPTKELYRDEGETFCLSLYMPALRALFYGAVSGLSGLSGSKPCFPIFYFNFFFLKIKKVS